MLKAPLRVPLRRCLHTTSILNSGHNKWSSIKHDKMKNDSLKNATSTKFAKSIAVATKVGGGPDPSLNFQLATAIENAHKANVPKKVIENAIKRGSGGGGDGVNSNADLAVYEGMLEGVSFVVEALTDNKARSAAHIKACFTKLSGSFAPTMFMFNRRGYIRVEAPFDDVFESAIELGAEDVEAVEEEEEGTMVFTQAQDTNRIVQELKDKFKVSEFGLEYAANEDTAVPQDSIADDKKVVLDKLRNNLENLDDVTHVYSNVI